MQLSKSRLLEMHTVAQMRGIALHRHHVEQLNRELERRGSMSMDGLFDRLRELGCRLSFEQEKGLRRWLEEIDATRAHRSNLDITRTRLDHLTAKQRRIAECYGSWPAQCTSPATRTNIRWLDGLRGNPPWVL